MLQKMRKRTKNANDHHLRAHSVIIYSSSKVFVFRKKEKLVALLVYSSFRRVVTGGFRNSSVSTSSGG